MNDLVWTYYFPQPEAGSGNDYITFNDNDYAQWGWIGYCSYENCQYEDKGNVFYETPSAITLGYDYSTSLNYFVFYATQDVWIDGYTEYSLEWINAGMVSWVETYFVWLFEEESSAASVGNDAIT
jgi:hypothetical protein